MKALALLLLLVNDTPQECRHQWCFTAEAARPYRLCLCADDNVKPPLYDKRGRLSFNGRSLIENPVCHPMTSMDCSKLPKEAAWFCRCAPPPTPKEMRA